jgi:hypothetical protein
VVDVDATLVLAASDAKQGAAGTYKHTFGFCPLLAYLETAGRRRASRWPGSCGPATPPPVRPAT